MLHYIDLFRAEQKIIDINGIKIGGIPGVNPPLLVGSIFYIGDKLLRSLEGDFDRNAAKDLIESSITMAKEYMINLALDVIFNTMKAVDSILPFVAEFDIPLFLDSPDPNIRIRAYKLARELGISRRCIANGVDIRTSSEELKNIVECNLGATVLLAFDPSNPSASLKPIDRLKLVTERLLPKLEENGIRNIIIDAVVIDPGSIVLSAETILAVKNTLGYPSGCAPANAMGPVTKRNFSYEEVVGIHSSIAALLRIFGADVIMYGPLKRIKYVAPAIASIEGLLGYLAKSHGMRIPVNHPIKILIKKMQKLFIQSRPPLF